MREASRRSASQGSGVSETYTVIDVKANLPIWAVPEMAADGAFDKKRLWHPADLGGKSHDRQLQRYSPALTCEDILSGYASVGAGDDSTCFRGASNSPTDKIRNTDH